MRRAIQRFVITAELGRGGMGVVYLAHDPRLERDVAIKLLERPAGDAGPLSTHATIDLRDNASPGGDLLAEARMMARLSHPNVLPIYEVGLEDDCVFLVMEYIAGASLRVWLEQPRTPAQILEVFAQAAQGLAAAHARGIVHRDFKPDNVLIGGDGRARVADFGLSGLVSASLLVHAGDGRGTPRYMAPELWRDAPPSPASDAFALCRALADAFGELGAPGSPREVPAHLRDAIAAGLDDDPAKRPPMPTLIAALQARPSGRARWPWAVAAGGIAATVAAFAVLTGRGPPPCADEPSLAGFPAKRASLAAARGLELAARLDDRVSELRARQRRVCEARAGGELGAPRARIHASCLDRRAIELEADVARVLEHPGWSADTAELVTLQAASAANCEEIDAPPIAAAPRTAALFRRLIDSDDTSPADGVSVLAALEQDAKAAGEVELEVRAATTLAGALRQTDNLTAADEALQRAYRRAVAIGSVQLQAIALVQRSWLVSHMGKSREAESYARLAYDLSDKPSLSARTRVRIYAVLGHASNDLGKYQAALEPLQKGFDLLAHGDARMPDLEADLRNERIIALLSIDGKLGKAIELARDNVAWTRSALGEASLPHASALQLLADALAEVSNDDEVFRHRRRALEITTAALGAGNSRALFQRMDLANELLEHGELDAAKREYAALLEHSEHNEGLRRFHSQVVFHVAQLTFEAGELDRGIQSMRQVIEEYTSEWGRQHPDTLDVRTTLADWLVRTDQLADAEREIAAIEQAQQRRGAEAQIQLAVLRGGLAAELDRRRGNLEAAERRARTQLALLSEVHATEVDTLAVLSTLGGVLRDQHRWREARTLLESALAITARHRVRADRVGEIQIELGEVMLALGDPARARALAEGARAAFARFPSHPAARRRAEAVLAPPPHRPR